MPKADHIEQDTSDASKGVAKVIPFPTKAEPENERAPDSMYPEDGKVVLELGAVPDRRFLLSPKTARQWAVTLCEMATKAENGEAS